MSPHPDDSLDELLTPSPMPPSSPADTEKLRADVLRRTTALLRRRVWLKRGGFVAALAACFLAGGLTMRMTSAASAVVNETPVETTLDAKSGPELLPPPTFAEAVPPTILEHLAARGDDRERAELLRTAGRRYLDEQNDPESALRCYTKALNAAAPDDLKSSPSDDWLLMALKDAREKENRRANDN
jgi:hypothetical protein